MSQLTNETFLRPMDEDFVYRALLTLRAMIHSNEELTRWIDVLMVDVCVSTEMLMELDGLFLTIPLMPGGGYEK